MSFVCTHQVPAVSIIKYISSKTLYISALIMNLVSQSVLLLIMLDVLFVPTLSFELFNAVKNLFSKNKSVKINETMKEAEKIQEKAEKFYLSDLGINRNTTYVTSKVYRYISSYYSTSNDEELTMDFLLHRTIPASGKTRAFPFDYLICNNVKIIYKDTEKAFHLKQFDCKDLGLIPKGLDKEVVAQAARSYAALSGYSRNKYVVLRVLKAEPEGVIKVEESKVKVTLSLNIQLVKLDKLLADKYIYNNQISILECSKVVVEYQGNPKKWTLNKFVKIKSAGKCKKMKISLYKKRP